MAFEPPNLIGTGTDQEILDYARGCLVSILAFGQAHDNRGKSMTKADLPYVNAVIQEYTAKVNTAANGMSVNYVRRLRPQ